MALVLADRVQEYSTTTGTGTLTLSGAYAGFQTFAAAIGNGNTCYYTISSDSNQWEVGIGTVGVGTLARTTLISSSTGSLVSFTGTLTVFVTYPAEKSVNLDASNVMTGYAISGGTINGTTVGATTANTGAFTTLTNTGTANLGLSGAAGSESLRVTPVASAVNYVSVFGAVTGQTPTISPQGSDTNIPLGLSSKGTSALTFYTNAFGNVQFNIANTASAVNYLQATGGVSGATPRLFSSTANIPVGITGSNSWAGFGNASAAIGVATDITSAVGGHVVIGSFNGNAPYVGASNYSTSSNNGLSLRTNGYTQFQIAHKDSAVNYIQVQGDTAAIPFFSSQGSSANIDMGFVSKGTGFHTFYTGGISYLVQFKVAHTASAVNYLQVTGGATGTAATLSAQGSDTNIDIALTPKGTGVLRFGTYTAGILAQAGYITIKDAGGTTRNLLVG